MSDFKTCLKKYLDSHGMIITLEKENIRKHFYYALLLGLIFRIFSVYFVWGPQGLDDYLDNLIPAWKNFSSLPEDLHDYRSPLYMWILSFWLRVGHQFGIESPLHQIRWTYFFQALSSLISIYAVYRLTRNSASRIISIVSMYLVALHGLMPFASTRSFMESFVTGFLTLALCLLNEALDENQNTNSETKIFFGYLLLGFSTLIRFQIGIIYIAWLGMMFFKKEKKQVWMGVFVGFLLLFFESGIDLIYGRNAFETLYSYVKFNSNQQNAGVMPWYNTWATWLGALYFPFSFLLLRGWKESVLKYRFIFLGIFIYVFIHSLNPHKEERYLYPILPLSFVFLASAWVSSYSLRLVRWVYTPLIVGLNSLILLVGCFINTQVGLMGPFPEILLDSKPVLIFDYDNIPMRNFMSVYFVRAPSVFSIRSEDPDFKTIVETLSGNSQFQKWALISQKAEHEQRLRQTHQELSQHFKCTAIQEASSWTDRLLFKMKPEKNQRRKPTLYFTCEKQN